MINEQKVITFKCSREETDIEIYSSVYVEDGGPAQNFIIITKGEEAISMTLQEFLIFSSMLNDIFDAMKGIDNSSEPLTEMNKDLAEELKKLFPQ